MFDTEKFSKEDLFSDNIHSRRTTLTALSSKIRSGEQKSIHDLVKWYFNDSDPRVRVAAFEVYRSWLIRGYNVTDFSEIYDSAILGLNDPHDNVVLKCLELFIPLSYVYPSNYVSVEFKEESIQLKDASFGLVASGILHGSFHVRLQSMILLRNLKTVSDKWLMEALEKIVMVDKVVRQSGLERQQGKHSSLKSPEDALKRGGASGVFVIGLEDEYYEIRIETIKTMSYICRRNSKFAFACQDLLVDMLTDDIEAVRTSALEAIRIAISGKIRIDQLDIVLGVLRERSGAIRRSVFELLGGAKLTSTVALLKLLTKLLQAQQNIPDDHEIIWKCAARIGRSHARFVEFCSNSLLQLHPYLTAQQPSLEDRCYLTVLLLIVNASLSLPSLKFNLPTHVLDAMKFVEQFRQEFILDKVQDNNLDSQPPAKILRIVDTEEIYNTDMANSYHKYSNELLTIINELQCKHDEKCESYHKSCVTQAFNCNILPDWKLSEIMKEFDQMSRLWDEKVGRSLWMKELTKVVSYWGTKQSLDLKSLLTLEKTINKMVLVFTNIPTEDIIILKDLLKDVIDIIEAVLHGQETGKRAICLRPLNQLSCFHNRHSDIFSPVKIVAKLLSPTDTDFGRYINQFTAGLSMRLSVKAEFSGLDCTEIIEENNEDNQNAICVNTPIVVVIRFLDDRTIEWYPPSSDWSLMAQSNESTSHNDRRIFNCYLDTSIDFSGNEWAEPNKIYVNLGVALSTSFKSVYPITKSVSVMVQPVARVSKGLFNK